LIFLWLAFYFQSFCCLHLTLDYSFYVWNCSKCLDLLSFEYIYLMLGSLAKSAEKFFVVCRWLVSPHSSQRQKCTGIDGFGSCILCLQTIEIIKSINLTGREQPGEDSTSYFLLQLWFEWHACWNQGTRMTNGQFIISTTLD